MSDSDSTWSLSLISENSNTSEDADDPHDDQNKQFVRDVIMSVHKQIGNINPELDEWFNYLEYSVKKSRAYPITFMNERGATRPVAQLLLLLRECLLSHRWAEATAVLSAIIHTPASCRHAIHRAGVEIMYNSSPENYELLEQFLNQVKRLRFVISVDIVLEYALYLLMLGKTAAASRYIKDLPSKVGVQHQHKISAHKTYAQKKYNGYVGITCYYEYRLIKAEIEQRHRADHDGDGTHMLDGEYSLMVSKANEAIDTLKTVLMEDNTCSYWDPFVMALVEVLEFRERDEEALQALKCYAAHNADNPNTSRYLIQYHQRHGKPEQELFFMQQFCDAVPSDEMVLQLYERLVKNGCPASQTLHLLFDLLDYGDWALQIKPWDLLAAQLERIMKSRSGDDAACIEECWSVRRSWWPAFHFTIHGTQQAALLVHKARAAAVLTGHDCAFVEEVLKAGLELKELKYLKRSVKRLHRVDKKSITEES